MIVRSGFMLVFWCVVLFGNTVLAHEILLTSEQVIKADQLFVQEDKLVVRVAMDGGHAEIPYSLSLVKTIRFTPTSEELDLLESGDVKRLPELRKLWQQRLPYLALPESDTGRIGLRLSRVLVASQVQANAEEALEIVNTIRERDWQESRKQAAMGIRISALAASGRIEQAMREANALESLTETDDMMLAETRVRSKFIQASEAWAKFLKLEADWPKWHLMPEKRKERLQHLNRALDHYLFPVIAHPELQEISAEGMMQAAKIYIQLGKTERARTCLDEVIQYFPAPAYLSRAKELKNTLNSEGKTS